MKVYIGPYKNWFGPYQLAETLCFWAKNEVDEFGTKSKPDWVHNFGEWLAHGDIEPDAKVGERRKWDRKRHQTWLYRFLSWIHDKKKRKIQVRIDNYDTWSMDHTLAHIVLPMLKQLKATKHGSAIVNDLNDVPENLRCTEHQDYDAQRDLFEDVECINYDYGYSLTEARWDYILDEMIFAFESKLDDSWEDQFESGEWDMEFEQEEGGVSRMVEGPNHTKKYDWEGRQKYEARIQNGFRLFGKYFQNLWD